MIYRKCNLISFDQFINILLMEIKRQATSETAEALIGIDINTECPGKEIVT